MRCQARDIERVTPVEYADNWCDVWLCTVGEGAGLHGEGDAEAFDAKTTMILNVIILSLRSCSIP